MTERVSIQSSDAPWLFLPAAPLSLRLACAKANPAKRRWEVFNLKYAVFWVGCFGVVIAFSLYEVFDEVCYA